MKKILGIDVGGTKLVYSVLDENGNFLKEIKKRFNSYYFCSKTRIPLQPLYTCHTP